MTFLDVTPVSLGIETFGGEFTKIIERNTIIPTRQSQVFSTAKDNQTEADIHILQGEHGMATFNKTIGMLTLSNISPAPCGASNIEIAFDIDTNDILTVSARDKNSNQENSARFVRARDGGWANDDNTSLCEVKTFLTATGYDMSKVIGIDLGTTNSVVSVIENGEPAVITNFEGSRITPSVVGFTKDGQKLVGQLAKRQAISNPDRTVSSIKRHMGEADCKIKIDGKDYTPTEISAMVLQKLKADAEEYLSEKVTQAVITVPTYFSDAQRQATKDAGKIAGLEVLRIINEPTAAVLAYGLDKDKDETVLVFDLGGGTFDVSIIEISDGTFEVKATDGDAHLGGDDFDKKVMDWMVAEFKRDTDIDLSKDKMAAQRLIEAAEKAKIELSSMMQTDINLPFITADANGPKHLDLTLTRAKFDELTKDLVERTIEPMRKAMADAKLSGDDIQKIILVGGSTRIPAVRNVIREVFGKEPSKGINPDECVSIGAAIQGCVLSSCRPFKTKKFNSIVKTEEKFQRSFDVPSEGARPSKIHITVTIDFPARP